MSETLKEQFKNNFNTLESYLNSEFNQKNQTESIKYKIDNSKNKAIKINAQFLRAAVDLRNLLIHNKNVAEPTKEFMSDFSKVIEEINNPNKAYDVMVHYQNIFKCDIEDTMDKAHKIMKENNISNIPILENGDLYGVFNESSVFNHLFQTVNAEILSIKETKFKDIKNALKIDNHASIYYDFIPRKKTVYDVADDFIKNQFKDDKRLELYIVTEHGKKTEKFLGILSPYDIIKYLNWI